MSERPSDVALSIALDTLDQIGAMTKRGRSAMVARAAAVFIRTQLEFATDAAPAEPSPAHWRKAIEEWEGRMLPSPRKLKQNCDLIELRAYELAKAWK